MESRARMKLNLATAGLALTAILLTVGAAPAQDAPTAEPGAWRHATSLIGSPGYPEGFAHFNYVNPDAPKGGAVRLSGAGQTFDTLNPILDKGVGADGLGLIYESLMTSSIDELNISAMYGQIADRMRYPADYSSVTYHINPDAKWHDGEPITAEDVVWSFDKAVELNQSQRFYYQHVTKAEATAPDEVTFTFDETGNRELPHIVGQLLVLPKHWWEGTDANGNQRDISKSTLEPPLGSGPYKVGNFSAGSHVEY